MYSCRRRLKQLLINMISNAIKFTLKGLIQIIVYQFDKNILKFMIKDTGVGMNPEIISKLGKPFSTFDNE